MAQKYFSNNPLIGDIFGYAPRCSELKTNELFVLMAVARRMNSNEWANQSRQDIAAHTAQKGVSSVSNALAALVKKKYLVINKKTGKRNMYQLHPQFSFKLQKWADDGRPELPRNQYLDPFA